MQSSCIIVQFPSLYSSPSQTLVAALTLTGLAVISTFSILSNGSLLWVILRQRSSSAGTNSFTRLLFLLTAADFIHSISSLIPPWFVWREQTVGVLACYHLLCPFLLALNYSMVAMLLLGVDRLLSVVAPIWWAVLPRPPM